MNLRSRIANGHVGSSVHHNLGYMRLRRRYPYISLSYSTKDMRAWHCIIVQQTCGGFVAMAEPPSDLPWLVLWANLCCARPRLITTGVLTKKDSWSLRVCTHSDPPDAAATQLSQTSLSCRNTHCPFFDSLNVCRSLCPSRLSQ